MANTLVPAGLTVQQWDDMLFREYLNQNFFKKFMGTGANSMIHVKESLTAKPGGSVTYQLVHKLAAGGAKNENETLEGNEREADLRSQEITIREYAEAVKWKVFDEQLTAVDLRQANKDVLTDWLDELNKDLVIEALGSINGTPFASAGDTAIDAWNVDNADRVLFGAARSNYDPDFSVALDTIDNSADKLTPGALSLMKRMAKTCSPKIRPYKIKNAIEKSDAYIVFAGSLAIRDLVNDTTFVQANREARQRGIDNPLFNGADYIWDNLFIYEIEDIPVTSNASIDVAPVYLCGAQALGQAWAKRPTTADETFDYGRKKGIGIKQWMKIEKLRFGTGDTDTDDPKDCGVVTGWFASVADS